MMMAHSSSSSSYLSARLIRCSPTDRPLAFGVWRQRGRGIEYARLRGSDMFRGSLSIIFGFLCVIHYYAFVCLLSCIKLYLCDSDIYVIVIFMWYVTCVLSTLNYLYVISLGYAHLLCFCVLLRCKWALFLVLMLISYHLSTSWWLGLYKLD